ncbi:MAG: glycosyltransferase family 2 protein [Opitutaceae bacterium]|nr:glycosyltransferase family 2 protein [Opitutaceae bacterium]
MQLSLIVPVFREEKSIAAFVQRVTPVLEGVTPDFEIVFCLDPSPDHTEEVILAEREHDPRVKLLTFSRRVGQPMATLAGLQYSAGAAVVVMDVDLQDPPELIPEMVALWQKGYDVVLAQRRTRRGEPLARRVVARVAYWLMRHIAEVNIPENTGDFRLMSRRVVNEINRLKECHGFLRGLVSFVGFRQATLPFDRPPRAQGESNYPVVGSLRIGLNGLLCFSTAALRLSSILGFVTAGGALLVAAIYLTLKLVGYPIVWGNPTMVILIAFLGGVQLITIGILGEYIGRIYDEVRMRPKYIVDRQIGF